MAKTYTIMIVEDDAPLRHALLDTFESESEFQTLEASDGEEGLELALKHHPDVILLDLLMPKKDGMTMLKELRQDKWGKDAYVMLLTNVTGPGQMRDAAEYGAYDYFVKTDTDLAGIVKRVKNHVESSN